MTTSEDRLLEIQGIIGAKLIGFMEKNVTKFGMNEDEQTAVTITTLTSCLCSFMCCVSENHGRFKELQKIVLDDIEEAGQFSEMRISKRGNNHDS